MMLIAQVMRNTHDNDDDTWQPLSLAAGRVLWKLCEQQIKSEDESSGAVDDKQRALDQEEFVKRGMERIRLFEERAADGARRQRRK